MARNKSGGLSKLLNFIGLVDDEDNRDTYGEEYSSDNYGRKAAYTPNRTQRVQTGSRAATQRQSQSASRRLPESTPSRSRYESRYDSRSASSERTTRYDDYRAAERRASSRFEESDYGARAPRPGARYAQQSEGRYGSSNVPQRREPQRAPMRVSQRSRTVMYSLHSLEDCCEVIDQLIANNTVVLTMDELDGRLLQRAVDTLSGAVFALHASIRKASDKTYLVAPMSVEVNEAYDLDRRF